MLYGILAVVVAVCSGAVTTFERPSSAFFICYNGGMDDFHKSASISDKITACGELEHVLYHARKSASSKIEDEELETFFQTVATMALNFRRKYMKKHFPNCPEELWCLGKAVETARQRIYEADEGDTEDLRDIDDLWNVVWGRITGKDLSGCASCREDTGEPGVYAEDMAKQRAGRSLASG